MTDKQNFGNRGEIIARNYLIAQHYKILAVKWQSSHLEIDIIAENETHIVFCEVKTRSSSTFISPQEAVTLSKQKNIIRAASHYVLKHKLTKEVRFDIIAIFLTGNDYTLEHLQDAFLPKW